MAARVVEACEDLRSAGTHAWLMPTDRPARHPRDPRCPSTRPAARAAGRGRRPPTRSPRRYPASSLAWAALAEGALDGGRTVEAYAYARTGYHRGLDALRRAGWRGQGPVPWSHEPNRGFLRALAALLARGRGRSARRRERALRQFLRDCDPRGGARARVSPRTTRRCRGSGTARRRRGGRDLRCRVRPGPGRAGVPVRVLDRGRRVGGRMALREESARRGTRVVDIGGVVLHGVRPGVRDGGRRLAGPGLARPSGPDTFAVLARGAPPGRRPGLCGGRRRAGCAPSSRTCPPASTSRAVTTSSRWTPEAPGLAVDGEPAAAVVLAMPQPQAMDLLPTPLARRLGLEAGMEWLPTLTVWAGWPRRWWPDATARSSAAPTSSTGSPTTAVGAVTSAAVLVVHSRPTRTRRPRRPGGRHPAVLAELAALLGTRAAACRRRHTPGPALVARRRRDVPHGPGPFALDETCR